MRKIRSIRLAALAGAVAAVLPMSPAAADHVTPTVIPQVNRLDPPRILLSTHGINIDNKQETSLCGRLGSDHTASYHTASYHMASYHMASYHMDWAATSNGYLDAMICVADTRAPESRQK